MTNTEKSLGMEPKRKRKIRTTDLDYRHIRLLETSLTITWHRLRKRQKKVLHVDRLGTNTEVEHKEKFLKSTFPEVGVKGT